MGRIWGWRQCLKNVPDAIKDTSGIGSSEGYSLMFVEEAKLGYTPIYPVRVIDIGFCSEALLKVGYKFWDQRWRKDKLLEVSLIGDGS